MILATVVAVLIVQSPYRDSTARRLVAAARARRETVDRSITAYQVTVRERIGAGVRALRRDRMLYRRELALRITWQRDSVGRIDVLGAREAVPVAEPQLQVPDDLRGDLLDYAFDPADDRLTLGSGSAESDGDKKKKAGSRRVRLRHPLAPGSEADYAFATGDSSVVILQDGRSIKLRELRVIPRRLAFNLVTGSLWIDEGSHGVVRALMRPARAFDVDEDLEAEDGEHVPGFLKPIRLDVKYISIDYSLWEGRWWLPRLIAFDGVASAGSWIQMPMRYELSYDDYTVHGDTTVSRAPRAAPKETTPAEDSIARARCHERGGGDVQCTCRAGDCRPFIVQIPSDTAALLAGAALPPAFRGMGDTMTTEGDLRQLTRGLADLPQAPWQLRARKPRWALGRFNRIEGGSLGAHAGLDLGRLALDGTGRVAFADGALDLEGAITRETGRSRLRLAGYRRLTAVDPTAHSLGFANSFTALFGARDDGDYYRATGVELTGGPSVTATQSYRWRIYAERQRRVSKQTDFSVPHLFDRGQVFRPNIVADSADQIGATLTLRAAKSGGVDADAPTWGAELTLDGGAGTFGFGRASLATRASAALTRQVAGAIEVAGGMSAGRVPVQSWWYLGGATTLRGYAGNTESGDAFWRVRAELANRWPAARLALFTDVGRAAPRDHLALARPLVSVGVGASFMDGLLRLDLTRAVRRPAGWRLDLYADGIL